jgi:hypothetical protein
MICNPHQFNVTLTEKDKEYYQLLPAGTKLLTFQCRASNDIRFAWETGKVASSVEPYMTLKSGGVYRLEGINTSGLTLYLASGSAGVVVEVEAWT